MPLIKLKNREQKDGVVTHNVSEQTLNQIMDIVRNSKIGNNIVQEVDGIIFRKSDFIGISNNETKEEFDLSNENDRKIIEEFGNQLEVAKASYVLDKDLEYYGELPMDNETWDRHYKFMKKTYKFSDKLIPSEKRTMTRELGFVKNPIIGTVHWSEVAWAEKEGIITRNHGGVWFVKVDQNTGRQMAHAKKFDLYRKKRSAWEAMQRSRANYQEVVKENEIIDSITVEGIDF